MTAPSRGYPFALLAVSASLAVGCDDGSNPKPADTIEVPVKQEARVVAATDRADHPVLAFEQAEIDFGSIGDWETRKAKVTFKNAGGGLLRISKVEPTCGCTSVGFDTSLTYGPDETGEIMLDFTPKGQGRQRKDVRVVSNDPEERIRSIVIRAEVVPALSASPRVLQLGRIPYRETYSTGTTITGLQPGIELTSVSTSGVLAPHLSATLSPSGPDPEGRPTWRADVAIDDQVPWGWFTGSMVVSGRISTDDGMKPVKMNFTLNGSSEGELAASDSMFRFLMVDASTVHDRSIDLRRVDRQSFRVLGTKVLGPSADGLAAIASPLDPDGRNWRIELQGTVPSAPGTFKGEVLVQTDVPGEEGITLRYSGVVRR
ncbi:MAG: DUF1573 domain-containing protein [Phycisphaera sp.]|nr:DUF1573 domain-containing protein [Phycisphaera sp.]